MIGYRYDSNGYLIGTTQIQESPLEPNTYLIPYNTTILLPPSINENEVQYWNGDKWEIKPNYSGKIYYSKIDKSIKYYNIGESLDFNYTEIVPLQNEQFQKWDEDSNCWIVDEKAKEDALIIEEEIRKEFELKTRQSTIQKLLLQSDYIELPSFLQRKGQAIYDEWMTYRDNLRLAFHNIEIPIPETPTN
jgi:hypothetical protein